MLSKIRFFVITAAIVCLAWLSYMTFAVEREGYKNLLLAAPNNENAGGVSVKELEKLNQEQFMLTYEVIGQKNVSPELSDNKLNSQSAVIKWTNYAYPFVMNCNILSGGFFTAAAQDGESKNVVLNELAAFEFFGGTNVAGNRISIDNTAYTVVGVINDRDMENKNVFIPITLTDVSPNVIMVMLDDKTAAEEYVKSELGKVGVTSSAYSFYNHGQTARIVYDRAFLAFAAVCCALLFFIFRAGFRGFRRNFDSLREKFKNSTFLGLFSSSPAEMFKAIFSGIFMAASAGGFIWILAFIANTILGWDTYSADIGEYVMTPFSHRLVILKDYSSGSNIFFLAFIALLALSVVLLAESGSD